ncbi:unnamed protein product [Brachionus calyciflorus]|uniref:TIR domain-containing protein n=1 Tax=Brachionus calyciflorus TaxID=104777 RepID=A0A813PLW0_9BILA|nr:unnamed protein product [Brachionus calyciflorus]
MEIVEYDFTNTNDDITLKTNKAIAILFPMKLDHLIENQNSTEALNFLRKNLIDYEIFCEKNFGNFLARTLIELFKKLQTFKLTTLNDHNSSSENKSRLLFILNSCLLIVNLSCLNSVKFTKQFSINNGLEAHFMFLREQEFFLEFLSVAFFDDTPCNIIELIVSNIYIFSKNSEELSDKWVELDAVSLLINVAKLKPSLKLDAHLTITNIVTDKQIENLTEIHGIIEHIQKKIDEAAKSFQEMGFDRAPRQIIDDEQIINVEVHCVKEENGSVSSLLVYFNGLYKLSVNDKLRSDIYFGNNFRDNLKIILFDSNEIEKKHALKLYAQLSFNKNISTDLSLDEKLTTYFKSLVDNNSIGSLCEQILWNISQSTRNLDIGVKNGEHVMISYNSSSRDLCMRIKSKLELIGLKVWIDVENIHGSSLDSMAKAYRQSINCQSEALYAYRLNKPIIPLIMQKSYENVKGWLGIIIGDKIFVNFTKYDFDECMKRLSGEIRNLSVEENKEIPKDEIEKISVENWDDAKCKEWFDQNGLNMNIYKKFNPCNGIMLQQLYEMRCDAPEFFYHTLNSFEGVDMTSILNFTYSLKKLFDFK